MPDADAARPRAAAGRPRPRALRPTTMATRLDILASHLLGSGNCGVAEQARRWAHNLPRSTITSGSAVSAVAQQAAAGTPSDGRRLLTDAQVRRFIATGYLSLAVDDTAQSVHALVHRKGQEIHEHGTVNGQPVGTHQPGNDIFPLIPELADVMCGGTVRGALDSLLGEGWSVAAHRHMHGNIPRGNPDQQLHKDSQRGKPSLHRPRQIFAFYVPRGATLQMGPTGVVPGSHLVSADAQDWTGVNAAPSQLCAGFEEVKLTVSHRRTIIEPSKRLHPCACAIKTARCCGALHELALG
eukprot:COSAG01_NODE_14557_length_1438_cov_2.136669_1_plen_297_part_00